MSRVEKTGVEKVWELKKSRVEMVQGLKSVGLKSQGLKKFCG